MEERNSLAWNMYQNGIRLPSGARKNRRNLGVYVRPVHETGMRLDGMKRRK
jgi:hypothetical protein